MPASDCGIPMRKLAELQISSAGLGMWRRFVVFPAGDGALAAPQFGRLPNAVDELRGIGIKRPRDGVWRRAPDPTAKERAHGASGPAGQRTQVPSLAGRRR